MANALQQVISRAYLQDLTEEKLRNIKPALNHLSLFFGMVVYTAVGAKIFQALEHPVEVSNLEAIQSLVLMERENLVRFVFNGSLNSVTHRHNVDSRLADYEQTVAFAATEGLDLSNKEPIYKWTYIQAVFFTSTILTTIGYGNIAPVTTAGRLFCIVFSIVGIPFTLSVIADVGQIFATLVSKVSKKYKDVFKPLMTKLRVMRRRRRMKLESRDEESGESSKAEEKEEDEEEESDDDEDSDDEDDSGLGLQINFITAMCGLGFLFGFLALCSFFFTAREEWTFFESFYFGFITVTTIGLGDMVPDIVGEGKTGYMLLCMIYILLGLAFASTIIELVRRQYAESWKKMQEIRAQLQAQIKLASTLRQMADAAGKNNIDIDGMDIENDLEQLKANINKFKKGKFGKGLSDIEIADLDWIDQNRRKVKAVTIFIYESSV